MLKKIALAGGIGLLLLTLTFGRDATSYVATAWGRIHDSVRDQVPLEFELDRARRMIERLGPEVRTNMHTIAKEEVAVERLGRQIDKLAARQAAEKENLLQLSSDLQSGQTVLVYAGQEFTPEQVEEDLGHRFERYKTNEETLTNLRKVLDARRQSLEAARQKLDEMLVIKQQLLASVANLEARQRMVELAQTSSEIAVDDSRLARTKDLLDDIRARIEVSERLVQAQQQWRDAIPVGEPAAKEVAAEVAAYFDAPGSSGDSLADAH